jgi:hypothetical protein
MLFNLSITVRSAAQMKRALAAELLYSIIEAAGMAAGKCSARSAFPLHAAKSVCYILSRMVQYTRARLDASFAALSDANRRGVLEQLGRADASITDLAEKFHMTLTGMKKHVGVLEQVGLVTTEKVGRVRTCCRSALKS